MDISIAEEAKLLEIEPFYLETQIMSSSRLVNPFPFVWTLLELLLYWNQHSDRRLNKERLFNISTPVRKKHGQE